MSNYAVIKPNSIADGLGVRVSVYLSGCHFHCSNCHNQAAWDFNYGKEFTYENYADVLELLNRPYIQGLSILGGEPFAPENQYTTCWLTQASPDVWIYTGYTWEELMGQANNPLIMSALKRTKVLVDGRYDDSKRDVSLAFRGSSNQRIIDVQRSLESGTVVLYKLD